MSIDASRRHPGRDHREAGTPTEADPLPIHPNGHRTLSVIIPAYNERTTIAEAVRRARQVELPLEREILVVDDGSTDGTGEILGRLADSTVRVLRHRDNRGKGAAIRTALQHVRGEVVVIHDADLEYDPRDWPAMLRPILEGDARVVYGSRFRGAQQTTTFWSRLLNRLVTLTANVLYDSTLSDLETGYKMAEAQLLRRLRLEAEGFEIEPEITAKVLRTGERIWEVPISYAARLEEGGKFTWRDHLVAVWTLIRYRVAPHRTLVERAPGQDD